MLNLALSNIYIGDNQLWCKTVKDHRDEHYSPNWENYPLAKRVETWLVLAILTQSSTYKTYFHWDRNNLLGI